MGGKFHLKLNIGERPIANKYREGKMKSTLKRESKGPEIVCRETIRVSDVWLQISRSFCISVCQCTQVSVGMVVLLFGALCFCASQHQFVLRYKCLRKVGSFSDELLSLIHDPWCGLRDFSVYALLGTFILRCFIGKNSMLGCLLSVLLWIVARCMLKMLTKWL